jgi:isochorismate synthase
MSSEKDRHEHVLVVQSIIECLQPFCKHVSTSQTKVISTSKLWHLSTTIEGELLDPLMSSLEIAYALHPTPAICGTPRKVAQNLIRRLEGTERNYFSGLVGWCDHEGNGIWAVTIRCALITQESAKLYAGAGIVEQSVAELEYLETGAKMETVLSALGVQLNKSDLVT